MKIVGEYELRSIAGETVVVPVGETVLRNNMLAVLNETGKSFWLLMSEGLPDAEIAERICKEYETDRDTALKDLKEFSEYLNAHGVITE